MLGWLYVLSDSWRHRARQRIWNPSRVAGRRGEDLAHRYLQKEGLTVVARNWRREEGGGGEIDIICRDLRADPPALVFVEVKSRQSEDYGAPDRAIGEEKHRSLVRTAQAYARRARLPWELARFDVVNVIFGPPFQIDHLRDVFRIEAAPDSR
ncbi:MAG TPA: YraN family protein [Bryobacteraceae bacterium]|jgi:putative endonuclease|nr:YraN family protein [Bryobacteraceae bacterium]